MPSAPRTNIKATKIAYSVLGVPPNMKKKSQRDKEIDKKLAVQNFNYI